MTDEDKALVKWLREEADFACERAEQDALTNAADRIEAQAAEIERLEKAIKLQASAVRTLQANEETEINILWQQKREWHQAVSSLDSEREANAILTAEIEKLREALKRIEQRCETFAHINLVGRSADAKEGGTLRNVLQDARAALGETK